MENKESNALNMIVRSGWLLIAVTGISLGGMACDQRPPVPELMIEPKQEHCPGRMKVRILIAPLTEELRATHKHPRSIALALLAAAGEIPVECLPLYE